MRTQVGAPDPYTRTARPQPSSCVMLMPATCAIGPLTSVPPVPQCSSYNFPSREFPNRSLWQALAYFHLHGSLIERQPVLEKPREFSISERIAIRFQNNERFG